MTIYEPNLNYSGDTTVELNGALTRIADLPDANLRAEFGYGHWPFDIRTRGRHEIVGREWPYAPDTCLVDRFGGAGEWVRGGTMLVCPGCGLDFT